MTIELARVAIQTVLWPEAMFRSAAALFCSELDRMRPPARTSHPPAECVREVCAPSRSSGKALAFVAVPYNPRWSTHERNLERQRDRGMSLEKKVVIIAGPNGAGKTTFAREFLPAEASLPVFINADLIAAGFSPFAPEAAASRAGRIMLEEIDRHAREGRSFAFETTLAGHNYLRRIDEWRADGFTVELIFLSLASAEEAIARVAMRVRQGGHDVPPEVIRRRFAGGMRHFLESYRQRVDFWQCYDNSGPRPRLVEEGSNR
jgi:predicted ABC-type ATPase